MGSNGMQGENPNRRDGRGSPHRLALACGVVMLVGSCFPKFGWAAPGFDQLAAEASAARDAGDSPRAIHLYGEAVRVNPAWPDGWWFLGSLEYGAGAYPEARDALTRYIALTPGAGPATALRGLCEFETEEYPQSLKDIEAGLAHGAANQPRNEHILRAHEALLLTLTGRFEDALRAYAFFAHDGAPPPEMAIGIGLAGLRTSMLPGKVPADRQELFVATGNAVFSFMSGDPVAAKRDFQTLFRRYPAEPNLHYVYGYFLFATEPDAGIAEFHRELEVAPSNAAAEAFLAWAELLKQHPGEARPFAQKAVVDSPSLPLAQLVLGRSMVDTGDLNGGILHIEKALELDPSNLENHLALAKAYSEAGRKQDARRERLQSLQIAREQ